MNKISLSGQTQFIHLQFIWTKSIPSNFPRSLEFASLYLKSEKYQFELSSIKPSLFELSPFELSQFKQGPFELSPFQLSLFQLSLFQLSLFELSPFELSLFERMQEKWKTSYFFVAIFTGSKESVNIATTHRNASDRNKMHFCGICSQTNCLVYWKVRLRDRCYLSLFNLLLD